MTIAHSHQHSHWFYIFWLSALTFIAMLYVGSTYYVETMYVTLLEKDSSYTYQVAPYSYDSTPVKVKLVEEITLIHLLGHQGVWSKQYHIIKGTHDIYFGEDLEGALLFWRQEDL